MQFGIVDAGDGRHTSLIFLLFETEAVMRAIRALLIVAAAFVTFAASSAQAENWMFRRSYYSHGELPPSLAGEMPNNRTVYRDPWVGAHPRFAIRGGWRFNTFTIQNGNGSVDRTYFRENWYDVNY